MIDSITEINGYKVLQLPPYHCELNPIELIWAQVKEKVRRENSSFKIADVLKLTQAAIQSVTARDWQKCIQHTIKLENSYWETDYIIEE